MADRHTHTHTHALVRGLKCYDTYYIYSALIVVAPGRPGKRYMIMCVARRKLISLYLGKYVS